MSQIVAPTKDIVVRPRSTRDFAGNAERWERRSEAVSTLKSLTASARDETYFFSFSIPFVAPLPGLVAQQKAELSPHAPQLCFKTISLPLPWPVTVIVELQPG